MSQFFTGIIVSIKNKKENGYGQLFINGKAPSILLENGKDCQSYENKNLAEIIKEATTEYPDRSKILLENLNTKYTIPYTVQYKESDYQFIKRLASRYGEYFYYDGQNLVFGNTVQPIIVLEENIDLIEIEFELNIQPQEFNYICYDSFSAENKERDSESVQPQYKENPFQTIAVNASKEVFKKKPDMLFNATSHQKVERDMHEMIKRQKESRQHLMKIKGKSKDPKVRIGGRVKLLDINNRAMETYRILEVKHFHDGNTYYNEFIGIPDIFIAPYFDESAFPECEEQAAIVTDNDNPQGMIRVQFPWQKKKNLKSPWLRVVTPYAGKGKGMHIIPEIGEEVIVGFDNGNAERPFVLGAMFNGKASANLGAAGNFIKGLQTPSGSRLQINDKESSLYLQDNGGVCKKFDGEGNATTNADSTYTVDVGEEKSSESHFKMDNQGIINLKSTDKIILQVGEETMITLTNDMIVLKSKTISIEGDDVVNISSKGIISSASNSITTIKASQVDIN